MTISYTRQNVVDKAVEILLKEHDGLKFTEWVRKTHQSLENINFNTVKTYCTNLDQKAPDWVYKPDRGFYRHTQHRGAIETSEVQRQTELPNGDQEASQQIFEDKFYQPFADWLVDDIEDCTKAIQLGGNQFRDKWGTPDVIGIRKSRESDIVKHETEIISAEIKIENNELITAFGQTCAYGLFSHRTYLVVPMSAKKEELGRIDSLCMLYGIGLVIFQ